MSVSDTGCPSGFGTMGTLDTMHADFARSLYIIPGHHNLLYLQKTVLLRSSLILCKEMSSVQTVMLV